MERPRSASLVLIAVFAAGMLCGAALTLAAGAAGALPQPRPAATGTVAQATAVPAPTAASDVRRIVTEPAIPFGDTDTATPDTLLFVRNYTDSENYITLVYLNSDSGALRWESPHLGDKSYEQFVAVGERLVYLADGARLMALSRADGSVAWERNLTDSIQNVCRDCLQVANGRVAVLAQDGVLQAFDAESGAAAWDVRLVEVPRQLVVLGSTFGVLDRPDDTGSGSLLQMYAAANGALTGSAEAVCDNPQNPEYAQRPGIYDRLFPDPASGAVFVLMGTDSGCAIKLRPDGTAEWRTPNADTPLANRHDGALITADAVYVADDGGVAALDARTGALRLLDISADYEVSPVTARDGTLVLAAIRTRGSRRAELWGVDAQTGERRWGQVLLSEDRYIDEMDGSGSWSAALLPEGLGLVQAAPDGGQMQYAVLRLSDGQAIVSASRPSDASGLGGIAWTAHELWLSDDQIIVLDGASGQQRLAWP